MKNALFLFLSALVLACGLLSSCEPRDEILTTDPGARLSFSTDTVMFDTVFVSRGSVTKRLLVYNPNARAVKIEEIKLGRLGQSEYELVIDGLETRLARNIELRGKDSLYVLVKVTIDPKNIDSAFLVKDSITFLTNKNLQHVKLVAYGQDAHFYRDSVLCTTTWRNDKPHVLVDTVYVGPNCTLTIEEGAQIFANNNAVLLVDGTLLVNGTKEKPVRFKGFRREEFYNDIPGQWEGIRILTRSRGNIIRFAEIRNALYGLQIGNPGNGRTIVENCVIKNMFLDGILSFTSDVRAVNTLISNCGRYNVGGLGGGEFSFLYCTFVNYNSSFKRDAPLFVLSDRISNTTITNRPVKLDLVNSIIWGTTRELKDEIFFDGNAANFTLAIQNNLIKTDLYKDQLNTNGNKVNTDPKFKNPVKQDFRLDTLSPANAAAVPLAGIDIDLLANDRDDVRPDIGAYEKTNE